MPRHTWPRGGGRRLSASQLERLQAHADWLDRLIHRRGELPAWRVLAPRDRAGTGEWPRGGRELVPADTPARERGWIGLPSLADAVGERFCRPTRRVESGA